MVSYFLVHLTASIDTNAAETNTGPASTTRFQPIFVTPLVHDAHMCLQCDGYSHEEAMRALDLQVKVHGWSVVQVGDDKAAFSYTVGLVENFGHPDLIILDVDRSYQHALVNEIAKGIATTGRPAFHGPLTQGVRCREVHTNHLTAEYFAMWANRYGGLPRPGQMMQVVLPASAFCGCHKYAVHRLDRPNSAPPVQLNRAQRRSRRPR